MVNLRNLSVILALRIEGAKFSGVLDKDINYLSGKIVQNMNDHSDIYFEILKFLVDEVMHGRHQDFWNFLPDFLIIDICKLVFPDAMLKDVQETIIEVEQQYY